MPESAPQLGKLMRHRERGGDLALLYDVFDHCRVATLATVLGDEPWSVPMLVVRHQDRLLLHGSTGAGALRHVAQGAKVSVSAFILDGLVIAERQFNHSANYRSAVVRGRCRVIRGDELAERLSLFTDMMVPGRAAECPPHSAKELAQTQLLELPITDGMWLAKARTGPAAPGQGWTGVIPVATSYGRPIAASGDPMPASVRTLVAVTEQ